MSATTSTPENVLLTRGDLHSYQETIVERILERPFTALWVDMGLGKTVAVATAFGELVDLGEVARVLVIAPPRVAKKTWPDEFRKWEQLTGRPSAVVDGTPRQRSQKLKQDCEFYFISNALVPWLVEHFGKAWPFDAVVVDESSTFKSAKSKRFKALKKVRDRISRLVTLTGTPTSNGLLDLWSQVYLLDRGERLGRTMFAYKNRFFESDFMGYTWTPRKGAEGLIYARLDDLCLTLSAEDYLSMPDRVDNVLTVTLPPGAESKYRELEREFILELNKTDVAIAQNAAVLTGKLAQCASGFVYDSDRTAHPLHDEKLLALDDIVGEAGGAPVLVAYNYTEDRERILTRYKFAETMNSTTVQRWNRGEIQMLVVHPASAGHGLNLQDGGNLICWYGLPWSLELYQQFNARLHRQGQTKPVIVHHVVAEGTVDEVILAALRSKNTTQSALLGALKSDIEGRVS